MTTGDLRISIITVCKNSRKYISETIESVLSQSYPNIEYILIDGDSTDGTIDIINKYENQIDLFISEQDSGMYDAINKGLEKATGDYILILNSDDVLASEKTIEHVVKQMCNKEFDYYYGNVIKSCDGKYKKVRLFQTSYAMLFYSTHCTFVHHSCFFISSDLNKRLGGYDIRYKYASDYDYILRAMHSPSKGKYLNLDITKFRIHDTSISASGRITPERKQILQEHGYYNKPYLVRQILYYAIWIYYKMKNIGNRYKPVN